MPADINNYFNNKNDSNEPKKNGSSLIPPKMYKDFNKKVIPLYVLAFVLLSLFFLKPYVVIDEGERGIKVTTGRYEANALEPGLHFIVPGIQKVILVDTKVRMINYKSSVSSSKRGSGIITNPPLNVLDSRGLPVTIELTVQYRLNQRYASQTISTWGLSWEDKIINPVVRDVVRTVVGQYEAESLPVKRNEIAVLIEDKIRENIKKLKNSPATLQSLQLREILLPQRVKEQIERVQLAKQQVEQEQQEVQKAKQIALKAAENARGFAEAKKIRAKGEAEARIIQAEAEARANKAIAQSLTRNLLSLEQIKVQGMFNDALRNNKDVKIFLTPGGSTPNIWVDMKDKQKMSSAK